MLWDPFLASWVVTGYPEASRLLQADDAMSVARRTPEQRVPEAMRRPQRIIDSQVAFTDSPRHRQLRGRMAHAFRPRMVEDMQVVVDAMVADLLGRVIGQGTMDVVEDLAAPLPSLVICHMLGVPREHLRQIIKWSNTLAAIIGSFGHVPDNLRERLSGFDSLEAYLRRMVAERRVRPRDDLISAMAKAFEEDDAEDDDELIGNLMLLLGGGMEESTILIGGAVLALLHHPNRWEELAQRQEIPPLAIEEFLRYDTPVQYTARRARADVEVGGQVIRAGQQVILVLAGANHDPRRFNQPGELILDRPDNRHLAFGQGQHTCFGAELARMEARTAIGAVVGQLREVELTAPPRWRSNANLRGMSTLPIRFRHGASLRRPGPCGAQMSGEAGR